MQMYHVSGLTGEPGPCSATVKPCPYGGVESHYATALEARAAYEASQKDSLLIATRKSPKMVKRPYLSHEAAANINVDGLACPACAARVSPFQAAELLVEGNFTDCADCGKSFDLHSMTIEVGESKDTYGAYDEANVQRMTWYHSTRSEHWGETLRSQEGFVAHVGSYQAALDRRIAEDYHSGKANEGFYLFEVKTIKAPLVEPSVAEDDNFEYGLKLDNSWDVQRYKNKWEDMASISLAANSNALEVQSHRFVTFEEAMASPSLYNVEP